MRCDYTRRTQWTDYSAAIYVIRDARLRFASYKSAAGSGRIEADDDDAGDTAAALRTLPAGTVTRLLPPR